MRAHGYRAYALHALGVGGGARGPRSPPTWVLAFSRGLAAPRLSCGPGLWARTSDSVGAADLPPPGDPGDALAAEEQLLATTRAPATRTRARNSSGASCRSPAASRCATAVASSPATTCSRSPASGSSRRWSATTPSAASRSPPSPARRSSASCAATSATGSGPCACRAACRRASARSRARSQSSATSSSARRPSPRSPSSSSSARPTCSRRSRRAARGGWSRSTARRPGSEPGDEAPMAERIGGEDPGFELVEDRAAIDAGAEVLDAIEREVLRLRFAEDLTQSKIAERSATRRCTSRGSSAGRCASCATHPRSRRLAQPSRAQPARRRRIARTSPSLGGIDPDLVGQGLQRGVQRRDPHPVEQPPAAALLERADAQLERAVLLGHGEAGGPAREAVVLAGRDRVAEQDGVGELVDREVGAGREHRDHPREDRRQQVAGGKRDLRLVARLRGRPRPLPDGANGTSSAPRCRGPASPDLEALGQRRDQRQSEAQAAVLDVGQRPDSGAVVADADHQASSSGQASTSSTPASPSP